MNNGMTRSTLRNAWMLMLVVMLGLSFMMYKQGQNVLESTTLKKGQLKRLSSELTNASRRAEALEELNTLTINERTATRLDILRHLGLEQKGYKFQVNARLTRMVGGADLHMRTVMMQTELPYGEAMNLIDRLHETRKIVINKIEISTASGFGDLVDLRLEGSIYGLDKTNDE